MDEKLLNLEPTNSIGDYSYNKKCLIGSGSIGKAYIGKHKYYNNKMQE